MVISEVPVRVGARSWGILPQELKNSILPFLPQPETNLPDRGSRELYLPRISPQGLGKGGTGGGKSRTLTKCLVGGCTTSSPRGVHFGGKVGGGLPHTCRSPQSPPCPHKVAWGVLRSRQEGGEWKEIILCSLAHSHIKSNSFIFTFIHPAGPGKG